MKILLQTRFYPSVGGIETLALVLCEQLRKQGCEITVATDSAADKQSTDEPWVKVWRRPSTGVLLSLWRAHDIVVMMNVSLKACWPMWFCRTPVVLTHHTPYWIDRDGARDWREKAKLAIARRCRWNICVSQFVRSATELSDAVVIPNCYDDSTFFTSAQTSATKDIIFVGRLVSDKGADILLEAIAKLPDASHVTVTIIGGGPEKDRLIRQAARFALPNVSFAGVLPPQRVAEELRSHRLLVVPSIWQEPFGIVALEGMACGCSVLVSDGGGLPEAVGDAGWTFQRGDSSDLAEKISFLLGPAADRLRMSQKAEQHLRRHVASIMTAEYLAVFERATKS